MKVYFVRHGQSIFNTDPFSNKKHQSPTTPLSEDGKKQAEIVANRFRSIPVDIIYSSSAARALETAEIMNKIIKKELKITDLLIERVTPSVIQGKDRQDPDAVAIKELIKAHQDDLHWHHSDEENFFDFKKRGLVFLKELENTKYDNILIVTHGYFLSLLALLMVYGDALNNDIYTPFMKFANTTNTGISMFEYKDGKWRLFTWNDYAHLG